MGSTKVKKELKEVTKFLNIGSGKLDLKIPTPDFHVHIDRSYGDGIWHPLEFIEKGYIEGCGGHYFFPYDIFDFMEHFKFKFDKITANRIFEHMEYCSGEIGRLLEACHTLSKPTTKLDIIVPNAVILSKMLLDYETSSYPSIKSDNIKLILNSEFNNIRHDPHLSCWSPKLAVEYIESEGTWEVEEIKPQINFAGRDIYMKIICRKVNK